MKIKIKIKLLCIFVLIFNFLVLFNGSAGVKAQEYEESPLTEKSKFVILQINDLAGLTRQDGDNLKRLARVAELKRNLETNGKEVLLILAGDFLSPSMSSGIFKGQQMIDVLNAMNVDLVTLGNHEFDYGQENLREKMGQAEWTWLVSNITESKDKRQFNGSLAYAIKKYGDLNVAFLGIANTGETILKESLNGLEVLPLEETVRKYIETFKKQKVNFIVLITHLNYEQDAELAKKFPEIDLILGGHEHFLIDSKINKTVISKSGNAAVNVARIDVVSPEEVHYKVIKIDENIKANERVSRVIKSYEDQLDKFLLEKIGETSVPLSAISFEVRNKESALGNFFADVMKEKMNADLAILNGGTIRSDKIYPVGDIKKEDLINILPFKNEIHVIEMQGTELLKVFEYALSAVGKSEGKFPQVSGVRILLKDKKINELYVGEEKIDMNKYYKVAVTDYMLKGGDGYKLLGKTLTAPEEGKKLLDLVEETFREQKIISPKLEGRIIIE